MRRLRIAFSFLLLVASALQAASFSPGAPCQKRIDYSEARPKKDSIFSIIMSTVKVSTTFGQITLKLRPDAAPKTVEHLPVHKSQCRGASPTLLNHGLHAIDATSLVDLRTGISANSHRYSTAAASIGVISLFRAGCSAPTAHPYQTR